MVTIWDVAADAGVSKSTVSLVLNNSPLVREETRQRVLKSIKALNYVPNYNARGLIGKKTNSIGLIHIVRGNRVQDSRYEWNCGLEAFSHDVEEGVFSAIAEADSDISFVKEHFMLSPESQMPKIIQSRRVDGAIIVGGFDNPEEFKFVESCNVPVVIITSPFEKENSFDMVFHSPDIGCYLATKKFIQTGHKHICLINVPKESRVWPHRLAGVFKAANEFGYSLEGELMLSAKAMTAQGAYESFSELIDRGFLPDAVIPGSNELAMGLMRCLYERNIRVPEDISVISYEDSSFCGNSAPALCAINIHKEKIGRCAFEFLMNRIENPEIETQRCTVEPCLTMRDSFKDRRS